MAKPGKRKFPLCDVWAKDILAPYRRGGYEAKYNQLEQAIYEALVEACQRGTPLPFGYVEAGPA
jgi:hypothetical protein